MIQVHEIRKFYKGKSNTHQVLHDISFYWRASECIGLIGESGSGKSTLGKILLGIEKPSFGKVTLNGENLMKRKVRRHQLSVVFQNYKASINPFFTVKKAMEEPLKNMILSKKQIEQKVYDTIEQVGLDRSYLQRHVHELSGGEAQRVCIGRAIINEPKYLILDEAISSLDIAVQLQILQLLIDLKKQYDMSYLFITHDLQAATYICDRFIILQNGKIVEQLTKENLKNTTSSYTKKLIQSVIVF